MSNNDYAYPKIPSGVSQAGLTKRELFAGMAMQGRLANEGSMERINGMANKEGCKAAELTARLCVIYADALMAELKGGE